MAYLSRKRPAQPDNSHPTQPPPVSLHNRINEVRRPNSHTEHIPPVNLCVGKHLLDDRANARRYIWRCGRFTRRDNAARGGVCCCCGVDNSSISVGAAHVYADAIFHLAGKRGILQTMSVCSLTERWDIEVNPK